VRACQGAKTTEDGHRAIRKNKDAIAQRKYTLVKKERKVRSLRKKSKKNERAIARNKRKTRRQEHKKKNLYSHQTKRRDFPRRPNSGEVSTVYWKNENSNLSCVFKPEKDAGLIVNEKEKRIILPNVEEA